MSYGRQRRGGTLGVVGVAILSLLFKLATNHTNKSRNFYCKCKIHGLAHAHRGI